MDSTRILTTQIMQPQYRNRHHVMIFGGFLLKQSFELAFCCAAAFSHSRPTFVNLDPSTFDNPVPVGSVLRLSATVAYTETSAGENKLFKEDETSNGSRKVYTRVHVFVDSSVRDVEDETNKPTGQFHYTFLVEKDIRVMPRTYQEFMIWIDARRRAQNIKDILENQSVGRQSNSIKESGSRVDDGRQKRATE